MENLKKKLESGAELEVFLATFSEGHKLFKAVTKELQDVDLVKDTVQKLSLRLISSEAIEGYLWPCMGKALYTGQGFEKKKITPEIFEKAEIRQDFLEIAKEVMVYNLTPFSKNVGSLSSALFRKDTDILR